MKTQPIPNNFVVSGRISVSFSSESNVGIHSFLERLTFFLRKVVLTSTHSARKVAFFEMVRSKPLL